MTKMIAIFILLSFATPVRAGLVSDFDPVEKNLIEKKQLEEDMTKEFKKPAPEPIKEEPKKEVKSGSNWWKWVLGIVVVGGIAAAAGGGGGGGGSSSGGSPSGGGSTVTGSW